MMIFGNLMLLNLFLAILLKFISENQGSDEIEAVENPDKDKEKEGEGNKLNVNQLSRDEKK